jgi:glutamate formiminotransferase
MYVLTYHAFMCVNVTCFFVIHVHLLIFIYLCIGDDIVEHSIDLCKEAFNSVSYDNIHGTHPALGVVDHVSFLNTIRDFIRMFLR